MSTPMRWIWKIILIVSFGAPNMSHATTFVQTNDFVMPPHSILASDLWLMANYIQLAGEAKDDLFLLATSGGAPWSDTSRDGQVSLEGEFYNDVWAMGNTVDLTGNIQDHARFLARTITIRGSIANNSIFVGNTIHFTRSGDIAADAWIAGENLIAEGWIEGQTTLIGKNVTLSGTFGQDVFVTAQDLVALPGTEIMGNLVYRCPGEFVPDSRVRIHGQVIRELIPQESNGVSRGFSLASFLYQSALFLGALLVAMIWIGLFPAFTMRAEQEIRYSLLKCMATGIAALGLIPLIIFFSLLSIIGIPLGLLLGITLAVSAYLSKMIVALALGTWLLRRTEQCGYAHYFLPLSLGLLLIYAGVNSGLPGLALWLIVTTAGLGAMARILFTGKSGLLSSAPPNLPRIPPAA